MKAELRQVKEESSLDDDLIKKLASHSAETLTIIGEDPRREGLLKTPERVAKSLSFLTSGYRMNAQDVINSALFTHSNGMRSPMMVCVQEIEVYSMCEHHMLPFFGRAHIAYFPDQSIIGLSKMPRLIEVFARRLQVQERLTQEIMEALNEGLKPLGVAVAIEASHLCMMMRGVQSQTAQTFTIATCGLFDHAEHRAEFLSRIKS